MTGREKNTLMHCSNFRVTNTCKTPTVLEQVNKLPWSVNCTVRGIDPLYEAQNGNAQ